MDINPKQFVKSNTNEQSSFVSKRKEIERDDDDPLSIMDTSLTFLGIFLASMTILLPSISIFLERPLLEDTKVIPNLILNKDGY